MRLEQSGKNRQRIIGGRGRSGRKWLRELEVHQEVRQRRVAMGLAAVETIVAAAAVVNFQEAAVRVETAASSGRLGSSNQEISAERWRGLGTSMSATDLMKNSGASDRSRDKAAGELTSNCLRIIVVL